MPRSLLSSCKWVPALIKHGVPRKLAVRHRLKHVGHIHKGVTRSPLMHRLHRHKAALANATSSFIGIQPGIHRLPQSTSALIIGLITISGWSAVLRRLLPLHLALPLPLDILLGLWSDLVEHVWQIIRWVWVVHIYMMSYGVFFEQKINLIFILIPR